MARVLFTSSPAYGHVLPMLPVVRAATRAGHEVRLATGPDLIDPITDASRVMNPEWLVVVGVYKHLGCIPLGQSVKEPRSEYWGCFCPCHSSKYDTSGRVRHGPAPRNLDVPLCEFKNPRCHPDRLKQSLPRQQAHFDSLRCWDS